MLYHLEGIDYRADPYAFWGKWSGDVKQDKPRRIMAKFLLNSLINAKTQEGAICACNRAMSTWTKEESEQGHRIKKRGKALTDARRLLDACQATGIKFADMLPLALKYHKRIAHRFGNDMGITLMNLDSQIALMIFAHFTEKCVPCLGCHDSFIVQACNKNELFRIMLLFYKETMFKEVGRRFLPVVKESGILEG